jgi:hypothetical protein
VLATSARGSYSRIVTDSRTVDAATWRELTHHRPVAAVLDLDRGAFACNVEAGWTAPAGLVELSDRLRAAHVQVVLVSGARRDAIDHVRDQLPSAWWYVEHGAWRYANRMWAGQAARRELDSLATALATFTTPNIRVSRSTIALAITWSELDPVTAAGIRRVYAEWAIGNPNFRLHIAPGRIEARLGTANKADVISWTRQRLPEVRCLIAGVDVDAATSRDLALGVEDAPAVLRSLAELRTQAMPPAPVTQAPPQRARSPRGRR